MRLGRPKARFLGDLLGGEVLCPAGRAYQMQKIKKSTQVLLGRLKCALPGWGEAESRRAADTAAEASCRSHASASGSGARGFDADSWGAGHGGDVGCADRYAGG
jgi:hypothetical protein